MDVAKNIQRVAACSSASKYITYIQVCMFIFPPRARVRQKAHWLTSLLLRGKLKKLQSFGEKPFLVELVGGTRTNSSHIAAIDRLVD